MGPMFSPVWIVLCLMDGSCRRSPRPVDQQGSSSTTEARGLISPRNRLSTASSPVDSGMLTSSLLGICVFAEPCP